MEKKPRNAMTDGVPPICHHISWQGGSFLYFLGSGWVTGCPEQVPIFLDQVSQGGDRHKTGTVNYGHESDQLEFELFCHLGAPRQLLYNDKTSGFLLA